MNRPAEKSDALGNFPAFLLLLLSSLAGVWFHFFVEPAAIRGAKAVSGGLDFPVGFHAALQLGSAFVALPFALLGIWLLSCRFRALQSPLAFAIYGSAMGSTYLIYGGLLLTPLLAHGTFLNF